MFYTQITLYIVYYILYRYTSSEYSNEKPDIFRLIFKQKSVFIILYLNLQTWYNRAYNALKNDKLMFG